MVNYQCVLLPTGSNPRGKVTMGTSETKSLGDTFFYL